MAIDFGVRRCVAKLIALALEEDVGRAIAPRGLRSGGRDGTG